MSKQIAKQTSAFLKGIKRILFQQSHLAPYLPFMQQPLTSKILRVYDDRACDEDAIVEDIHEKEASAQTKRKGSLQSVMMISSKQCYYPLTKLLLIWYFFVFMAIMYSYVEMGVILTYGEAAWTGINRSHSTMGIHLMATVIFAIDVYVQLNTGYIFRGVIITERARVVSQYLRTYFLPDIIFILLMILSILTPNLAVAVLKIIVVAKLMRMLDMDEFYMRRLATSANWKVIYVISKQMITIFLLSHTVGLFFYVIDYALVNDPICQNNNSLCWLYSATAYSPIIQYDWQIQYFYTVYWGVNTITTISYGDIAPNNPQETIYALFFFCFGFIVYGYVVNNIIKVILWARRASDNFKHQLIIYTTYMENLRISKEVQYEVRDYLELQYIKENQRVKPVEDQMKSKLPQELRDQLLKSAYYKLYNHIEYILGKSPSITKLLYHIDQKKSAENEQILQQGAPLHHLYYLHDGEVALSCRYGQKTIQLGQISSPDTFLSHLEFLLNERATYSLKTIRTSIFYVLHRDTIEEALQNYTDLREHFKLVEYELRCNYNYARIFYKCFLCRSNHPWHQCTETFPNFNNTKFILPPRPKKRQPRRIHHTWKDRAALSQLAKINDKNSEFLVLQKVKERIYELKKLKQDIKSSFEVDVCHDWAFYLPDFNFSVFKAAWNQQKTESLKANALLQYIKGMQ